MIYEYEGTFIKFVVVLRWTGADFKAECRVIDLRQVRNG